MSYTGIRWTGGDVSLSSEFHRPVIAPANGLPAANGVYKLV